VKNRQKPTILKPRFYTPESKRSRVIAASLAGKSNSRIARQESLNRFTVIRILSQPEVAELRQNYRQQVLHLTPYCIDFLRQKMCAANGKAKKKVDWRLVIELLKGSQILVNRVEEEVTQKDEFAGRTTEELRYFAEHGCWPARVDGEGPGEKSGDRQGNRGSLPN